MSKTTTIVREGESCEVTCINPGKVRSLVRSIPGSSSVDRISGIFQIAILVALGLFFGSRMVPMRLRKAVVDAQPLPFSS